VPPRAKACPECGSDEETGWSERATADRLGIPAADFDYQEFVNEEFGEPKRTRPRGISWLWWVMALIALAALLALLFRSALG
jgi:hypothetical protein